MFEKGLFGGLFDFNNDGKLDSFEQAAEFATVMHFAEESQKQSDNSNYSSGNFYSYTDDTDETEHTDESPDNDSSDSSNEILSNQKERESDWYYFITIESAHLYICSS